MDPVDVEAFRGVGELGVDFGTEFLWEAGNGAGYGDVGDSVSLFVSCAHHFAAHRS